MPRARFDLPLAKMHVSGDFGWSSLSLMAFRKGGHSKGSGARSARDRLYNQSSRRMKLDSTRLRRGFFLESGYGRPLVSTVRRRTRQNRSIPRSALRKNSPAASTASMAKVRVSTAVTPVTDSQQLSVIALQRSAVRRNDPGAPFPRRFLERSNLKAFVLHSSTVASSQRDAKVSKGLQLT